VWLGGQTTAVPLNDPRARRTAPASAAAFRRIVVPLIAGVTALIVIGAAVAVIVLGSRPRRRPR
jgi:hypothetical protein